MAKFNLDDDSTGNNSGGSAQTNSAEPVVPGLAEHAKQIAAQSPEVQQHAIDEAARQAAENESKVQRDKNNEPFDASRHTGTIKKDGTWRLKKGVSTLGTPSKKSADRKGNGGQLVMTEAQEAASRAAGAAAAAMMFSSCTMLFGDEWQPRKEKDCGFDENKLMGQAFGDYFVAKNVTDFPPGVTLAFLTLGYMTARFQMPKTRTKLQGIKAWIALRIARNRLKKEFKKAGIVARVEIKDGILMVDGKANWEERLNKK